METEKSMVTDNLKSPSGDLGVNTFAEHGNEIEEIISNKPPYIVRWGTVYFFLLLLMLGLISWFIKYPDIVIASAALNSVNAPQEVITRTDGKLTQILIKENEKVNKGEILGYMESIANPQSVRELSQRIDSINDLISQNHTDEIVHFFPSNSSQGGGRVEELGELQDSYQTFIQAFITFRDFISNGFYLKKKKMLAIDMLNLQKLHAILLNQKSLMQQDLALSDETFSANKTLANQKVISAFDFRDEESKLIGKQLSLPQINASIVANEGNQNDKLQEIAELENQIVAEKNTFVQALQTIKSQIQAWEYKYVLIAPVSGIISFTGFFQENQEMKAGQLLFYVQPENTSYYVETLIPQYNSGKVKKGQKVLLKFQAYPFEQFGAVLGKIDYIKTVPADSGYLAKIILPQGLITNYKRRLQYRNGMIAEADIITQDMRLMDRLYNNAKKQYER
ncbi:MAG TPA: HlyD family efflux transporter periplasmic adaptor subunit [Hanamia sp.]